MSKLVGSTGQYTGAEFLYDASGTIASGGTAQLLLPRAKSRSSLIIENASDTDMLIEFGQARATATLTGGAVSSCSVSNAGMGYSLPPRIHFYGGQDEMQTLPSYTLRGLPDWPSPSSVARAHCVMAGSAPNMTVSSIVMDSPGLNYAYPPFVFLTNDLRDPYGVAVSSATSGILLKANGGSYTANGTICTTDPVSIFCATTGKSFVCKFSI